MLSMSAGETLGSERIANTDACGLESLVSRRGDPQVRLEDLVQNVQRDEWEFLVQRLELVHVGRAERDAPPRTRRDPTVRAGGVHDRLLVVGNARSRKLRAGRRCWN